MNIRFLPEAQQELDDAFQWYETQSSGLGQRLLNEVMDVLGLIRRFPDAWHPLSANTRRCRLKRFPYSVVYAVVDAEVLVIAISHQHRQPLYWVERSNRQ